MLIDGMRVPLSLFYVFVCARVCLRAFLSVQYDIYNHTIHNDNGELIQMEPFEGAEVSRTRKIRPIRNRESRGNY